MLNPNLKELRARYVYKGETKEHWSVLTTEEGPLEGDCEDYALTALWYVANRSWFRFWWLQVTGQACIWQANFKRVPGAGHAVLWVRGCGYTDSYYQDWQPSTPHRKIFPYIAPFVALKLLVT